MRRTWNITFLFNSRKTRRGKLLLCTHQDTGCSLGRGSFGEEAFERCLLPVIVVLLVFLYGLAVQGSRAVFGDPRLSPSTSTGTLAGP